MVAPLFLIWNNKKIVAFIIAVIVVMIYFVFFAEGFKHGKYNDAFKDPLIPGIYTCQGGRRTFYPVTHKKACSKKLLWFNTFQPAKRIA